MFLQLPFLFAFYAVLTVAIEMRGAQWFWFRDLSRPEPYYILLVLMIITQVLMQKMTPTTSMDPAQQRIMLIMPVFFAVVFFSQAASGLVLYWLTSNVVGIAQQWFFNRATPSPVAAPAAVAAAPKNKKSPKA